jgi:NADPH-dependent ferric siderophore reductase
VSTPEPAGPVRVRRPPPPFVPLTVRQVERRSPRLVRITLAGDGDGVAAFAAPDPAASVRLLLPVDGELVLPTWDRNVFLLPDGRRAPIRTMTPRRVDAAAGELDLEIVDHGDGPASTWAAAAAPGDRAAVSGPARGFPVPADATGFLVVGDESAIAAISLLLEALPRDRPIEVHLEVAEPGARVALPDHPAATVTWHDKAPGEPPGSTLVEAVRAAAIDRDDRVWAAGEAAAMQRIRRHLYDERDVARPRTWIRGYWKHGRTADDDTESADT